jgi:hypothetical protein
MTNIAMENPNGGFSGKIIHKWAIFHGYVEKPEGIWDLNGCNMIFKYIYPYLTIQ